MNPVIEKHTVAQSFGNAAPDYDQFARVQHLVAEQLIAQCPELQNPNGRILDLGCGTGYCLPLLAKRYPSAKIEGADISQGMLTYAQEHYPQFSYHLADAESLPFDENQFQLIFSNFAVQWCDAFSVVLEQLYRCLQPGGFVVLSTLADGTLNEIKSAWAEVDQYQHVNDFETADALEQSVDESGFSVQALSMHTEVQYYQNLRELTDSLKRIGAHNMTSGRARTVTSPGAVKQFKQAMERFRLEAGLPASYQVLTCVLQKPTHQQQA